MCEGLYPALGGHLGVASRKIEYFASTSGMMSAMCWIVPDENYVNSWVG